ncbi:hypothetical protein GCM10029992_58090 [Glycomyces albus]
MPDRRDPVFRVPDWVELPDFLAPHLAARNAVTVAGLPYEIERVLHFSNGGGIYLARDKRTGDAVVLKEGRPHAGLDFWGKDAVERVEHEHEILRRLEGIPGVPRAHDLFWLGEHRFLAMEYIDGQVLSKAVVTGYPMIDPTATGEDYRRFCDWAMDVHRQVEQTLRAVHDRGVAYGDLHLFNVIERTEGGICLLDFEVAGAADATRRAGLGNQGFAAPRSMTGADADRYSLACLKLALFLPMTNLIGLHRLKARHFASIIEEHFPVPAGYLDDAVELIAPSSVPAEPFPATEPEPDQWPTLRDHIARAIVASATPTGTTGSSPATSSSSPPAGSGSPTARPGSCTRSTPPAPAAWSASSGGCSTAPSLPLPAPGWACTTACTARPSPSTASATGRSRSTSSTCSCPRTGSGSAPTWPGACPGSA